MISYPPPLTTGDTIGVTAPSTGVPDALRPRLEVAMEHLRGRGFEVRLGEHLTATGLTVVPAAERAGELQRMLTDPAVRAVVPPWGGEIAIDLLERLDWDALAADPTWLVGFSDISTLLLPLTLVGGVATLHGQNLMDTPYRVPSPLLPWLAVASAEPGASISQGSAPRYRAEGFDDWESDPTVSEYTLDTPGGWIRLDAPGDVEARGRLIGGCLETVAHLVGTPFGDVPRFGRDHAPEGLVVYLESAGSDAADTVRRLFAMRYAGWFEQANVILLGRTRGKDLAGFTHHDAARHALGDLGIPVIADVDCGHVPPHLALVNGALATVRHTGDGSEIVQELVP